MKVTKTQNQVKLVFSFLRLPQWTVITSLITETGSVANRNFFRVQVCQVLVVQTKGDHHCRLLKGVSKTQRLLKAITK
jgi:hypothetical protein